MNTFENWVRRAVEDIWIGMADRIDSKEFKATAYRVKNIIRIDIKIPEDKDGKRI